MLDDSEKLQCWTRIVTARPGTAKNKTAAAQEAACKIFETRSREPGLGTGKNNFCWGENVLLLYLTHQETLLMALHYWTPNGKKLILRDGTAAMEQERQW